MTFLSCSMQEKSVAASLFIVRENGKYLFKHASFIPQEKWQNGYKKEDTVYLRNVLYKSAYTSLSKKIDPVTFEQLYNIDSNKVKVSNPFYLRYPYNAVYFTDDKNIYFYDENEQDPANPAKLILAGEKSNYKLLGGGYLSIAGKIFYNGKEVVGADLGSFKTFRMQLDNSEWALTVGYDKNNIYLDEKKMDQKTFERNKENFLDISYKDLQRIYFK